MTTTAIRKRLTDYLQTADDKKVRAIYTMVEDEIETRENDYDEETYRELELRSKSFADGTAKTLTWEDAKKAAIDSIKIVNL